MRCLLVMIVLASACRSSAPSPITCELAADHLHAMINAKRLRIAVADICRDRNWSDATRGCVASVQTLDELRSCSGELGPSADLVAKAIANERKVAEDEDAVRKDGIRINLPDGRPDIDVTKQSLVVVLTGDAIVVGGRAYADADIDNLFRAAYTRDHAVQVIIKADRGIAHAHVVSVMERAKLAGITHLAIGTTTP